MDSHSPDLPGNSPLVDRDEVGVTYTPIDERATVSTVGVSELFAPLGRRHRRAEWPDVRRFLRG